VSTTLSVAALFIWRWIYLREPECSVSYSRQRRDIHIAAGIRSKLESSATSSRRLFLYAHNSRSRSRLGSELLDSFIDLPEKRRLRYRHRQTEESSAVEVKEHARRHAREPCVTRTFLQVQKYLRDDHGDHRRALVSFFLFTVSPIPWLVADALLTARYFRISTRRRGSEYSRREPVF